MKKLILTLCLAATGTFAAVAQMRLTLDQALDLALFHNYLICCKDIKYLHINKKRRVKLPKCRESSSYMKKCYEYVAKKFGDDYAQEIMHTTPENIINGR